METLGLYMVSFMENVLHEFNIGRIQSYWTCYKYFALFDVANHVSFRKAQLHKILW